LQQFCPPKTLATWFWPAFPAIIFGLWFTWFRLPCNKVGFFNSHGQQMINLSRFDLSGWIGSMATYNGRLWILHIVIKLQTSCCTMFGTKHCAVCLVQSNGKLFDTNLVGCCTHLHCWWVGTTLVWEPLSPCHPWKFALCGSFGRCVFNSWMLFSTYQLNANLVTPGWCFCSCTMSVKAIIAKGIEC
jgi:hypothetical protein